MRRPVNSTPFLQGLSETRAREPVAARPIGFCWKKSLDGACEDALATLAAFDLQDLISLEVSSLAKDCGPVEDRTRLRTMRPIGDGDPFILEARFPDRESAQTWKLEWEARDGEPLALSTMRTTII